MERFMSINAELRAFFTRKGLTQKEIGERIGVAQPAVALLLSRDYIPDKAAKKLEEAFGLSYTWLRTGAGPMMADGSDGGAGSVSAQQIVTQRMSVKDNATNNGDNNVYCGGPDLSEKLDAILKELQELKSKVDKIEDKHLEIISGLINGNGK